ncbi:unnamed protein product [Mycena citricolor]|uniref:Translation initiation factor 3 N-terminal domain-containing protein n=1 Tax=Mycena citricolor TaxID=2018698 RepID=A0AAD2Q4X8_9AGAR|nr:unnamed protein product [Mycena citricolor]
MNAFSSFHFAARALLHPSRPIHFRCLGASLSHVRFMSSQNLSSKRSRRLRNAEIGKKYAMVTLVREDKSLMPTSLNRLLDEIDLDQNFVELVTEDPEPIVRIVNKRLQYQAEKQAKADKKTSAKHNVEKEVHLTWVSDAADLKHRLAQARSFLEMGSRVSVMFETKPRMRPPEAAEMEERVNFVRSSLEDVATESKPVYWRKRTAVVYLQGTKPKTAPKPNAAQSAAAEEDVEEPKAGNAARNKTQRAPVSVDLSEFGLSESDFQAPPRRDPLLGMKSVKKYGVRKYQLPKEEQQLMEHLCGAEDENGLWAATIRKLWLHNRKDVQTVQAVAFKMSLVLSRPSKRINRYCNITRLQYLRTGAIAAFLALRLVHLLPMLSTFSQSLTGQGICYHRIPPRLTWSPMIGRTKGVPASVIDYQFTSKRASDDMPVQGLNFNYTQPVKHPVEPSSAPTASACASAENPEVHAVLSHNLARARRDKKRLSADLDKANAELKVAKAAFTAVLEQSAQHETRRKQAEDRAHALQREMEAHRASAGEANARANQYRTERDEAVQAREAAVAHLLEQLNAARTAFEDQRQRGMQASVDADMLRREREQLVAEVTELRLSAMRREPGKVLEVSSSPKSPALSSPHASGVVSPVASAEAMDVVKPRASHPLPPKPSAVHLKRKRSEERVAPSVPSKPQSSVPLRWRTVSAQPSAQNPYTKRLASTSSPSSASPPLRGISSPAPRPILPAPAARKLSLRHLQLLYDTRGGTMYCRNCRTTFPDSSPWSDFAGHSQSEHPDACAEILALKPAQAIEMVQRQKTSAGLLDAKK